MSGWQPGDVALCVDDRVVSGSDWRCPLLAGRSYTVTATHIVDGISPYGEGFHLILQLLEASNPPLHLGEPDGFDARRFIKQPSLVIESEEKQEEPVE